MKPLNQSLFLITGVTSGIGEALVAELIKRGSRIIGIGRNKDKLASMAEQFGEAFTAHPMDVTDIQQWHTLVESLEQLPDRVVLNAGNAEYLENGVVDSALVERIFQVNFMANIYAAEVLLPKMSAANGGQWAVVSSSAAFFAMPRGEAYGASKAALNYFFESLQLSYHNIDMVTINPGFVETPLTDKNDFDMPMIITAAEAAVSMADGLAKNKREINFPRFFTAILKRLGRLPISWRTAIGRKMVRH